MNKNKHLLCILSLAAAAVLGLAGCAAPESARRADSPAESSMMRQCAEALHALDAAVERAGVRDAEAYRVAGFPYLRVDRFSAQLQQAAGGNENALAQWAQWVSWLRRLDQEARSVEIRNLPDADIRLLDAGGRASLLEKTAQCADAQLASDLELPERRALLRTRAQVPDAYSTGLRVAGLYVLTRLPFAAGIAQWEGETLRDFKHAAEGRPSAQPLVRYALANAAVATPQEIAAIIRRASDNPLRIPAFSEAERALLVSTFAPVFEVETGGAFDRIGRLRWGRAATPEVDTAAPAVYHRIAYTRHRDFSEQTLTQIVYTIWFSERPRDHALDRVAGRLDGVMFRVTLSPDGEPLVYDSIHPCGCFHLFFPTARVQAVAAPGGAGEWAFAPATLPVHSAGSRMAVRIATRTHYLTRVALDAADRTDRADRAERAEGYTLVPEDVLRSLPAADGARSVFGPDGMIAGTERGERVFFWPMGIPNAGAMRQWGRHATAFVGRRHFDDADLIEKRFRRVAP